MQKDFRLLDSPAPLIFEKTEDRIFMKADKGTNLFNDMCNGYKCSSFPYYYTEQTGDFLIRCKITPEFIGLYDLGCIVAYENENKYIKFAYENSDAGHPAMVSVVTNGVSDDSNGESMTGGVWMQMMRKGNEFALHYSKDKVKWILVRIFRLPMKETIMLGISAQSPIGPSCEVVFEGLEVLPNPYEYIRNPEWN